MKKLLYLVPLFLMTACDTVEEKFLYDESDTAEFAALQELSSQECITNATVFNALDSAGAFESTGILNKIYRITQDLNPTETIFVKVTAVSATQITMIMDHDSNTYDKVITFTKTNHDELMTEFKTMACNPKYEDDFSAGGLTSSDSMTLKWSKETVTIEDSSDDSDDEPEAYKRRTDNYTIDKDFPLFFFFFNGTKESKIVASDGAEEVTNTSKLTIEDYTTNEACDEDGDADATNCKFDALDSSGFATCDVVVNTGSYERTAFEDEIIQYSATSGTCTRLVSGT